MKLTITTAAAECFRDDWNFASGDNIRIFVRYSGGGEDAFAFGIMKDDLREVAISSTVDGITFYVSRNDAWYWEGHDLLVDCRNNEISVVRQ